MTTFSNFGVETTGSDVAAAFSEQIRGKHVLIVGVSPASLGEHMAVTIALHKPELLLLASRSPQKINEVISQIRANEASKNVDVRAAGVDLSSLESVRKAAQEISNLTPKLDVVINNAGVNVPDRQITTDGLEMHFATNHIGLFLLTNLLVPKLEEAAKTTTKKGTTRIVNISSAGHRLSPIRFSDYNFERTELPVEERPPPGLPLSIDDPKKPYSSFLGYAQSKTANILYSVSLTEKLKANGIVSYGVHPGSIWTGLSRNLTEEGRRIIEATSTVWKNGDQGAATALVAAFDPSLGEPHGVYMLDCQFGEAAAFAVDSNIAERLWKLSEKLVGQDFVF